MATKKAAKKVATKKTTKTVRAAKRKMVEASNPFYVVVERGFLSAKAHSLFTTREAATAKANALEAASSAAYNKYTVQRVELID